MKNKFLILFGILFLLNTSLVSSHFVCGIINDSDDGVSASWFNVKIFYPEDENNFASCEVSPEENKYCCDLEEIEDYFFNAGKIVFAKVSSPETGYAAGPVSLILTNEAYDIFPLMKLEKVINIFSPDKKIIFFNSSEVFLNASFLAPYNFIEIEKNENREILCEDCENYEGNFSGEFGMNNLEISASHNDKTFIEELNFVILNKIDFNREAECKGCKNNKVKSSTQVNMKLNLSLSNEIEGFLLREYMPVSWEIIDSGEGKLMSFNEDYNLIIWNITGKDFLLNYSVRAPNVRFRPQEFLFKTELEDFNLSEDKLQVRRFFPFWAIRNNFLFYYYNPGKKTMIDSTHPLVFASSDGVIGGGVFSNKKINNAKFRIYESNFELPIKNVKKIKNYFVSSNLNKRDIREISFEVKLKKEEISLREELRFFLFSFGWKEIKPVSFSEDGDYFYFSFKENLFSRFVIGEEKKSFFRRIF